MVTLSPKEKWLIDAGIKLLRNAPASMLWHSWSIEPDRLIAGGGLAAPLPHAIAEIAVTALRELAAELRRTLDKVSLPDREEDEIVNDLELIERAKAGIVRDLGQPAHA